jgi:hypothetical protein
MTEEICKRTDFRHKEYLIYHHLFHGEIIGGKP